MTTTQFGWPCVRALGRGVLLLALVAGCGGGVDSGGTGASATYATGPIGGYGSIIVDGVLFDDSRATVTDEDGLEIDKANLKLGRVVEIFGSAIVTDAAGDRRSTASRISVGSEIVGPIDSPDPGTNPIVVLGRSIYVQPTTIFENVGGRPALRQNDVIEVYGLYDAGADRFVATRIERKDSRPAEFRMRGKVSSLDAAVASRTFMIGTQKISYVALPSSEVQALANGSVVRVRFGSTQSGGAWPATRLRAGVKLPDNGTHAEIEGLIDSVVSPERFSVGGVPVSVDASSVIEPAGTVLVAGMRVEVEGRFVNGVLVAREVEVKSDGGRLEFEIRGLVEVFTASSQTFQVRGQSIGYAGAVEFRPTGKTAADLRLGVELEVKAVLVNGNQLQATRVEFK